MFASRFGTPLLVRNVIRSFKAALARAGLPTRYRVHDLRHAMATVMMAAGVHPKVAAARLGHSTVGITLDLYTHRVEGLDADAAERIQRALGGDARAGADEQSSQPPANVAGPEPGVSQNSRDEPSPA